jgi:spore coat protein CotH
VADPVKETHVPDRIIFSSVSALLPRSTRSVAAGIVVLCGLGFGLAGCAAGAAADTTAATAITTMDAQPGTTPTASVNSTTTSTKAEQAATSGGELFDSSTVHEVTVAFAQEDYEAMIATYKSSTVKDWITATVTIDGVTFENVGMRLKGNSSIRGLAEGRQGGPGGEVSATAPESLPWLIRLDKNVEGQNYDGIVDLVVRSSTWETSLNEAVSLELLQMAGLASQKAIAVRFSVNGGAEVLRLATELPDDEWMDENLDGGALYKAEATGDYSYRGADPASYDEVFDQEAGKDDADLTPLIEFLDFINNSDDATFGAELQDRLDIDAFATYLAMEELIGNFDDIDGPGNNSYLYYDLQTGVFTVVPWDHNLAFGGFGGGNTPAGAAAQGDAAVKQRGHGKANILVTRFHANAEFQALYVERLAELKESLYGSGDAAGVLDRWVALLEEQASDLVDPATVQQEAAKIAAYFTT